MQSHENNKRKGYITPTLHHRVVTLVAVKLIMKDSVHGRFTLVLQTNCIRQLERQLPSDVSGYYQQDHGCNTKFLTATLNCVLVTTPSQML